MDYTKVIIVGGGIAGLAAAKTLGRDVNYTLVEAQNYLGGRIFTVDAAVPNLTLDLGAQYVHGDKKNSVYDICEELNILLSDDEDSDDEALVATSEGKILKSDLLDKATDLWERARDKAEDKYDDRATSSPVSFADFVPGDFQKRLSSSSSFSKDLISPLIDYFMKLEMTEAGCISLNDLNLIEYVAYEELEGEYENDLKNGGYRPFINYFKSFIPNERVRLNCEVTRVTFMAEDRKLSVEINYLNERRTKTLICDHIIWTTSLGYLKEHFHSIFASEPKLIQQKQNPIANLGFGIVNKVLLIYKKKFWRRKISSIVLLHTNPQQPLEMSDLLREQLQAERVDPNTFQEIVNTTFHYDVLPSTDIPVLICWFVGPAAIKIENLSDQLVGQICHEVLCQFLQIPQQKNELVQTLKSAWYTNKYIRGSYSYSSNATTKHDRKQLAAPYAPDGIPRILFAGEATHPGYYSTVNAALETGIQAAKKLSSMIQ